MIRPREIKGGLTLTIDPKYVFRIRGMAVDNQGKRVADATVTLRWHQPFPVEKGRQTTSWMGSILETCATGENGWFFFRGLWPGLTYDVIVEARGRNNAEAARIEGKAGDTHDTGKLVLISASGALTGRVVASDGRPIAGASVFNHGDSPESPASATDAQGRFRLDGLFPGPKYVFVRKHGYRFTGVKASDDDPSLTIKLLATTEPVPRWKTAATAIVPEQQLFARKALVRLWDEFGADADNNGAFRCIMLMAQIDPELALEWSGQHGHQYDDRVRQAQARELSETDVEGAGALECEA